MTAIRRRLFRSCPLLLLALATTSARAADDYLKLIPSTALAWGAVNHMNEASEKIKKLAVNMPMPAVDPLDEIKKESGLQKGLDEKGAAGFFVLPSGAAVYFVAVADEKAFLGNFQVVKAGEKISEVETKTEPAARSASTYFLAFRNGYALLSSKKDRTAVEAAVEAKQSIAAEMAGLEPWMAENDGTVVGTAAGIKYVAKLASKELKESQENMGQGPDAAVLRVFMDAYGAGHGGRAQRDLPGRGRHPLRQTGFAPPHWPGAARQRRPGVQGRGRNSSAHRENVRRGAWRSVRHGCRRRRHSQAARCLREPGHGFPEGHEVGLRDVGGGHGTHEQRIARCIPPGAARYASS